MKRFIIFLFSFFITFSSFADVRKIILVDKENPSVNQVIDELLKIQSSLIIDPLKPIPQQNQEDGFILISMKLSYVKSLLEDKDGIIVAAQEDQTIVGYIILTNISEFMELYEDPVYGFMESNIDIKQLHDELLQKDFGYIEQIAVKPGYSKKGIGKDLIQACQELKNGLVADVFIEPVSNLASLNFFQKIGFNHLGILYQYPRANFPYTHRTQIFIWEMENK